MQRKLKILFVTPSIPYPPYRGDKLRIYNIINVLKKNHNIKVLSFLKSEKEIGDINELKRRGIDVEVIKFNKIKSYLNLLSAPISKKPLQILYYFSKEMREKIVDLTTNENFDVVYFHIFTTAQYCHFINNKNILKVLDMTDAYSLYLDRLLKYEKHILRRSFFRIEKERFERYKGLVNPFDSICVCSPIDKKYLERIYKNVNILVYENGIDTSIYNYQDAEPERHRIIFTGNLPYFPNRDAIKFFIKEIFPLILKVFPDTKLYIVGKDPTPDILTLANKNIIVKGFVEDLKNEYLLSQVNIAPMRYGAGTANKIIEAMCLGVPTVATSIAVSGFDDEIKKYVFVSDTPEEFAGMIIEIFQSNTIRTQYMKEASQNISNLLNLDFVVGKIERYFIENIRNFGK